LSRRLVIKQKVYGAEHPHEAQKPQPLAIQRVVRIDG
jgi:hypothetical protein